MLKNQKRITEMEEMPIRFRSVFEAEFASDLQERNIEAKYENDKIRYVPKTRLYTPDFYISSHNFYVETKGRFLPPDRAKHLLIQKQHPDIDIRFIFMNANIRLDKRSKSTYGDWCDKYNFKYAVRRLPEEWMK